MPRKKGLELYSCVIITNHIHLIAGAKEPFRSSDIAKSFKKSTANQLLLLLQSAQESRSDWTMKWVELKNSSNKDWQFCQHDNHPIELYNLEITKQKLDYLHLNPVVPGFVTKAEEYLYYNSAIDYYGGKGLL